MYPYPYPLAMYPCTHSNFCVRWPVGAEPPHPPLKGVHASNKKRNHRFSAIIAQVVTTLTKPDSIVAIGDVASDVMDFAL